MGILLIGLLFAGLPVSARTSYTENGVRCSDSREEGFEQCITNAIKRERAPAVKPDAEVVYVNRDQCRLIITRDNGGEYSVAEMVRSRKVDFGDYIFGKWINRFADEERRAVRYGESKPSNKLKIKVLVADTTAEDAAALFVEHCSEKE